MPFMNKDANPQAKYQLSNIHPVEVSVCGMPAVPGATIQLVKARNVEAVQGERIEKFVSFIAKDEMKKQLYAYVLIPEEPDWDGDVVTKSEVEGACDNFGFALSSDTQKGTGAGLIHQVFDDQIKVAQNCIDVGGVLGKALGFANPVDGAWLIKLQVLADDIWKSVMDGTYTGVSMGGFGDKKPIDKSIPAKPESGEGAIARLFKKFGFVKLAAIDFETSYSYEQVWDELPAMLGALDESMLSIAADSDLSQEQRVSMAMEALEQFKSRVLTLFGKAQKQFKAMKSIVDQVHKLKMTTNKKTNDNPGVSDATKGVLEMDITQEALNTLINAAVAKAIEPLQTTVKSLEEMVKPATKSAEEPVKIEETEYGKRVDADIELIAKAIDQLLTKVMGSNAGSDVDGQVDKDKPADDDSNPDPVRKSRDRLAKHIAGTAFSIRR